MHLMLAHQLGTTVEPEPPACCRTFSTFRSPLLLKRSGRRSRVHGTYLRQRLKVIDFDPLLLVYIAKANAHQLVGTTPS
jgi:hypothetical protein